jgi:hypothetical protein
MGDRRRGVWEKKMIKLEILNQAAAESGSNRDIKNARTLFLRLKPGDR